MNKSLSFNNIMPSLLHKSQDVKDRKFSAHCRLFEIVHDRIGVNFLANRECKIRQFVKVFEI